MNPIIDALMKRDRKRKKAHDARATLGIVEYKNLWMRKYNRYINSNIRTKTAMGEHKAHIIIPKIISKDDKSYVKYFLGPNQKDELVKVPSAYVYARNKVIESFQACGYAFNPYTELWVGDTVVPIDTTTVLHPELDPYYDYNISTHNSKPIYCDLIDIWW